MSYHDLHDLQASFDSAASIVHEAFPKQVNGDPMFKDWAQAQSYIAHGAQLSLKFSAYTNPPIFSALKGYEILHLCLELRIWDELTRVQLRHLC